MSFQQILTAFSLSLALMLGHWLPWATMFKRKLPRLAAYTLGVGTILAAFFAWSWPNIQAPLELSILCAVGGGTVFFCYAVDEIGKAQHQRIRERNVELRKQR